ncbi:MAG: urease accessory UreF family protein [Pseudomonadota bacterium]
MTTEASNAESQGATYRLLSWLSPSFPVGAYAFSHGLEYAVESGQLRTASEVESWLADLITAGSGQSDLRFAAAAWHAGEDLAQLADIAALSLAFCVSAEIRRESVAQGDAFVATIDAAWPCRAVDTVNAACRGEVPYPVAVGSIARSHEIDCHSMLTAYAHGFTANLTSAAVRLVPLGQTDGQRTTANLSDAVADAVALAAAASLDDISSNTIMSDIASMRHETQYTRLFRS